MTEAGWTPRERVRAALEHREPDRVPYDLGTTGTTGIHVEALRRVLPYLGLEDMPVRIGNVQSQLADLDEELRQRLGVDTQAVPRSAGDSTPKVWREGDYLHIRDKWGILWIMPADRKGLQYAPVSSPLAGLTDESELESYPWPDVASPRHIDAMAAEAKRLYEKTDRALAVGSFGFGMFQLSCLMRGYESFLLDLALNPSLAEALVERILELKITYWNELLPKLDGQVLVVREGDDYGYQTGMQISPAMFRVYFKPRLRRLFDFVKRKARSRVHIYFHSCGAIRPIIGDLIGVGVEALNPIQVSAADMDTRELKAEFGADLTFWGGGVDTQRVLPTGTPQEVKEEVRRRIEDLAPGGGFVFAAVQNIQSDVPPENLMAMWEALDEYGRY
ncbi:MAG: hypothetical protein JSW37_10775 [Anaerolineales bacterium]|nr:MAG: hypothetical protein JSW37_10775 [Anaerolineales bacterium]